MGEQRWGEGSKDSSMGEKAEPLAECCSCLPTELGFGGDRESSTAIQMAEFWEPH